MTDAPLKAAWDALARAEQEVFGDHLTYGTVVPILRTLTLASSSSSREGEVLKAVTRYDLITNYRCGSSIEEMEPSDDGDWVRFEDVLAALTSSPSPAVGGELREKVVEEMRAYEERNRVVAALAHMALRAGYKAGTARTAIEGWSDDWHGCVYIEGPWGQASWHFHDSQAHLFAGLPAYEGAWDGHTTEQKYERLAALTSASLVPSPQRDGWEVNVRSAIPPIEQIVTATTAARGEGNHRLIVTIRSLAEQALALLREALPPSPGTAQTQEQQEQEATRVDTMGDGHDSPTASTERS